MDILPYHRRINYYETDKMGITHHSNYVRFMEEARVYFLEQIGWGFDKLEAMGYLSPVLSVSCKYKQSTVFNEEILISVKVGSIKGVKFTLVYEMTKAKSGHIILTGETEHCFIGPKGMPVRVKNEIPDFYNVLITLVDDKQS